jgi:hypothetical protein
VIYGRPAGSLASGAFGTARTRTAGAAGERLTAQVLDQFWDRAAIFHDLAVPGYQINVDHAVLSGDRLLIIDSKVWPAGSYWSLWGSYFKGVRPVPPHHKPSKAMEMAWQAYSDYLHPHRIKVLRPLVAAWSGSQATGRYPWVNGRGQLIGALGRGEARPFLHYTYPGAKLIPGNNLYPRVDRFIHARREPNPAALRTLTELLY